MRPPPRAGSAPERFASGSRRSRVEPIRVGERFAPAAPALLARVIALALLASNARAAAPQETAPPSATASRAPRPVAVAKRVATPPVIDGRLDDAVWAQATPIGPLTQAEPREGAPASEATEVRVLYDSAHLYLGVRCFDREPQRVIATQRARDAVLDPDDRVEIVLDTFHDRRNAYFFQMNAAGSKGDALLTDNGRGFNKPWDGIWDGRASTDAQGWSFEMALPFKTLSFARDGDTWGLNVNRWLKRRNEQDRWAAPRLDSDVFILSDAGDLTGLEGLEQGVGLDLVPFFVGTRASDHEADDVDLLGHGGLDLFYKLTPNLTLAATFHTDFAETEVDERQINLTRFPLFFPEKRDFFLQDSGIFQFADLEEDLVPFFSRTIGLSPAGEEVPILAGLKLTGRAEDLNIGVLDVQTDSADALDSENLFVARVSKNVGEQSTVGGIVTHGNPESGAENTLYGVDYNFRTSSFGGDKNLRASVWGLETRTDGDPGDDLAFGGSVSYPNDRWRWDLSAKEIQANFDPALGFVPRRDVRRYFGDAYFRPRLEGDVRQLSFGLESEVVTDLDDQVETVDGSVRLFGVEMDSGDELRLVYQPHYESLDRDFDITDDVTIPKGHYAFERVQVEIETALKRPVSVDFAAGTGEFFGGDRTDFFASVEWRPNALFTGSTEFEENLVSLPGGDFTTQLARLRMDLSFTPDLSWFNFLQWDNESNSLGLNSRTRWIPVPGQEFFVVFNQVVEREDDTIHPLFQEVAFKASYTVRF